MIVQLAWVLRIIPTSVALIGAVVLCVVYLSSPRRTGALIAAIGAALLFLAGIGGIWLTNLWTSWVPRSTLPPHRTLFFLRYGSLLLSLAEAVALALVFVAVIVEGRRPRGENP